MSKKCNVDEKTGRTKPCRPVSCGVQSPGPKYQLRPLTGYPDHCLSRNREPAYSIAKVIKHKAPCGPGPKYKHDLPWDRGYTIPKAKYSDEPSCTPGPKYTLPGYTSPAYTIVFKPKDRCAEPSSGPYSAPPAPYTPAYSFGGKGRDRACEFNPPLRDVGDTELVRPANPRYSIGGRHPTAPRCRSPGPKYYPKNMKKAPEYSFGLKYSECVIVPRTECDEKC